MSYRVRGSGRPVESTRFDRQLLADEVEPPHDGRFSLGPHILAAAVVLMLFASLLGPLNRTAVVVAAAGVIGLSLIGALARHGVVAGRTVLLVCLIVSVVAIRAYLDPPSSEYGHTKWVNFCTVTLATMMAAAAVLSDRTVRALSFWWVLAGAVLALLAISGTDTGSGRAQVDGSNPVWLGRAIAASTVVAVWMALSGVWRWWRTVLVVPLLVAGLLATGSRGPAMAAVVGVLVLLLVPTDRRSSRLIWVGLAGTAAFVVAPFVPAVAESRFGRFLAEGDVDGEARSSMWLSGLRAIPDNPWGAGLGEWSSAVYSPFAWPHNIFIEVFIEQGWLVGLLLVGLVVGVVRRLWRRSGNDPSLQLALALVLTETVHVSTSGDLNARTFFFVLLLGVSLLNERRFRLHSEAQSGTQTTGSRG